MSDQPKRRKRNPAEDTDDLLNKDAVSGHNSSDEETTAEGQTIAAGQLRALLERIERLTEERKAISEDIKEIYAEAKGTGFDTKAIRTIVRLRNMDQAQRQEQEAILDLYKAALGMV